MLAARSASAFRQNPVGGFVAGERWFFFCIDERLFGYAIWGAPNTSDVQTLVHVLEQELVRPRHMALVDLCALESADPGGFEALASYTIKHHETLARIVTKAAVVRPPGVIGAIVSGFFEMASRPFPVSFCNSTEDGLRDLGCDDPKAWAATLAHVMQQVAGTPQWLLQLRTYLSVSLEDASTETAAAAFGISARTLQRRLTEERTSFEAELLHARLGAARTRLTQTDQPITAVALEIGFQTAQHFAVVFRRHTGESPTEFRARHRR